MNLNNFAVGLAALGWAVPTSAGLNVPIAARVVSFVQPVHVGAVPAAILFAPGNEASEAEADAIERMTSSGIAAGRGMLKARRVPIGSMGALNGYQVAFVTTGLRGEQDNISAAAARSSVLTISSDPTCVQAGHCVVGIVTSPKVQITVSRAAARAANIRFGSAFLMLVKEI